MKFTTLCGTGIELSEEFVAQRLKDVLEDKGSGCYIAATLGIKVGEKFVTLTMQRGLPDSIELLLAKLYVKHKTEDAAYFAYASALVAFSGDNNE